MTDGGGPITATDERYRRDLDENVVATVLDENLVVIRLRLADVAHSPALDTESGLAEDSDVSVAVPARMWRAYGPHSSGWL